METVKTDSVRLARGLTGLSITLGRQGSACVKCETLNDGACLLSRHLSVDLRRAVRIKQCKLIQTHSELPSQTQWRSQDFALEERPCTHTPRTHQPTTWR